MDLRRHLAIVDVSEENIDIESSTTDVPDEQVGLRDDASP